ncbi:hypothetical protein GCM10022276_22360 [Sphingomonas limnosediminicola]|uniref:Tetratricopeptide repeat protein n=1 Tax=Sphingomonas limnosediminicola TaxID=940133 RepID=A0ABP7LLA5_9SPHN
MAESWQDLLQRASQLRQAGRVGEAIDAYKRVLAINSALPAAWYNLGWLQKQARAFDDALASYDRALALKIDGPEEVHLNRAVILADHLQQPDAAKRELDAALAANPRYAPALLNLGNLMEDLGDRAGARDTYQRALEVDPRDSLALARLGGLSLASGLDHDLAQRLREALAHASAPVERADLGFALAGMLDAAGEYDEAFDAASAANAASRAATGAQYNREAVERFIDRSIAAFPSPVAADESPAPVFICGMFRSGSTLLEQILGSHRKVAAAGELDLVPALAAQIPDYPNGVANAGTGVVERWRETYLAALPVRLSAEQLVTDKRPDNFLHIGLIKTLFPAAKILHTRRAPLDNLLSLYFLHLDPAMSYALDLDDAAHWLGQYRRLMAHWKALYPSDILDVDYDVLVRAPEAAVRSVLDFLGIDWEDQLLDFHQTSAPVKTASVWQVRQPLHGRSSGRWRNYEKHLFQIRALKALNEGD